MISEYGDSPPPAPPLPPPGADDVPPPPPGSSGNSGSSSLLGSKFNCFGLQWNEKSCFSGSTGEKSKADKSWFGGSDNVWPSGAGQSTQRPIIEENRIVDEASAEESKESSNGKDEETLNAGEDFDQSYITALLNDMAIDEEAVKENGTIDETNETVETESPASSSMSSRKSVPEIRKQLETPRVFQGAQTEARKEAYDLKGMRSKKELWVEWVKHYQIQQKKHDTSHPGGLRVLVSNEGKLRELYKEFCIDQQFKGTERRDSEPEQTETNALEANDAQHDEPEQ